MKRVSIVFGYLSLTIIISAIILKENMLAGTGLLLLIGLFVFSFLFLPCYFISRFSEANEKYAVVENLSALASSLLISLGLFFKISHWAYSTEFLSLGLILLMGLVFPIKLYRVYRQGHQLGDKILEFVLLLTLIAFIYSYKIDHKTSMAFVNSNRLYEKANHHLKIRGKELVQKISEIDYTENQLLSYHSQRMDSISDSCWNFIEQVKLYLVKTADKEFSNQISSGNIRDSKAKNDPTIANDFFFEKHDGLQQWLYKSHHILSHSDLLRQNIITVSAELNLPVRNIINTDNVEVEYESYLSWGEANFYDKPLAAVISTLSEVQFELLQSHLYFQEAIAGELYKQILIKNQSYNKKSAKTPADNSRGKAKPYHPQEQAHK